MQVHRLHWEIQAIQWELVEIISTPTQSLTGITPTSPGTAPQVVPSTANRIATRRFRPSESIIHPLVRL